MVLAVMKFESALGNVRFQRLLFIRQVRQLQFGHLGFPTLSTPVLLRHAQNSTRTRKCEATRLFTPSQPAPFVNRRQGKLAFFRPVVTAAMEPPDRPVQQAALP